MSKLKKLTALFTNMGSIKLVVILGLAGMVLIMLSEVFSGGKSENDTTDNPLSADSYTAFSDDTEERLKNTLESIEGVGKTEVMITFGGTSEYVYAKEEKRRSGEKDKSAEDEYVLIGSGGDKQALLQKILSPEIKGVAVVCEGGDSSVVKERIYSTVSALLGLTADKIYVTKLN